MVTEESCLALSSLWGGLLQGAGVLDGRGRATESNVLFWRTKNWQRPAMCAVANGMRAVGDEGLAAGNSQMGQVCPRKTKQTVGEGLWVACHLLVLVEVWGARLWGN